MADQAITGSSAAPTLNSTDYIPIIQQSTERAYATPQVVTDFVFANPSTWGAAVGYGGKTISHFLAQITATTSTAYTLTSTNTGEVVTFGASSTQCCIVGATLASGFNCTIVQKTTGRVTFESSGGTLRHSQAHTAVNGQYAAASIFVVSTGEHYLVGDTAV